MRREGGQRIQIQVTHTFVRLLLLSALLLLFFFSLFFLVSFRNVVKVLVLVLVFVESSEVVEAQLDRGRRAHEAFLVAHKEEEEGSSHTLSLFDNGGHATDVAAHPRR